MNLYKLLLIAMMLTATINATEYTFTKKSTFNPLLINGYKLCENNATQKIKEEAIATYLGCSIDTKKYEINSRLLNYGDRSITLDECSVEATYEVTSNYFDDNDF